MAKKVFFDTNPLIYFVSGYEPYYSKVFDFFTECIENDVEFYTSTITGVIIKSCGLPKKAYK